MRRPRRQEHGDVAAEITDRGQHPAHRSERSVGEERLVLPLLVFPAVAVRQTVRRHVGRLQRRGRHAERPENVGRDIIAVRHLRHVRDDSPEDGEAVVGILVCDARSVRERNARAQHPRQLLVGVREMAIPPRVVFRKSFGVRQQMADRDARRVARRIRHSGHLRHVPLRRIVERQLPFVAQLEDRHRGEALGHRRDAEHAIGIHRRPCRHVAEAAHTDVRELSVDDDAPRGARHVAAGRELREECVDVGEPVSERRRRPRLRARNGSEKRDGECDTGA